MITFSAYVKARDLMEMEQIPPVPPGVDPEMWANPSYRKFWMAQNQPQQQVPQQQQAVAQQPRKAARALGTVLPDPATLGPNHHLVARNLQIAMSPAGTMTYPFYWSQKENRAKNNPYYKG
jgi:hypothetical protein